jgi:antirestriction protein
MKEHEPEQPGSPSPSETAAVREEVRGVVEDAPGRETRENPPLRIYVACLAAYNNGILHGRWIDCDQGQEAIEGEIAKMLAESPIPGAEEWAIHDYEIFGGLRIGEYESIERIAELSRLYEEHGELALAVVSHVGGPQHLDEARRLVEEEYEGHFNSLADWAEDFLESTGSLEKVPEPLRLYIDFESYAHDCELNGDVFTVEADGAVHVFRNR